jgi:CheY-like chemotaxis protein
MVESRILLIDDNHIFGSQVVAAFADAGIPASWVTRGSAALPLLAQEATRPELLIVDLVRPASAGRWLLQRLQELTALACKPLTLALVPVVGTYDDFPDGVEVQVKPIFPSQVVASARRLLGLGMAVAGTQAAADSFLEDTSDFGPADTLLVPSNIEELARAMTSSSPSLPPAEPSADETARMSVLPLFHAITAPLLPEEPALAFQEEAYPRYEDHDLGSDTELLSRTLPLLRPQGAALQTRQADFAASAGLCGDVAVVPLIDVVNMLARQRQSGMLHVLSEAGARKSQVSMAFRGGRIDLCTSVGLAAEGKDLRIGNFVLEAAALSHAQIDEIEERRQAKAKDGDGAPPDDADLLGMRLCQEGLLSLDELRQALSRQTAEILYAALRLCTGKFYFDHGATPPRHATSPELGGGLELDTAALVLEGYRRIRDYHLLDKDAEEQAVYVSTIPRSVLSEEQAPSLHSAASAIKHLGLSDTEVIVLGLCNGRLSQGEIAKESQLPLLQVGRTIQRLSSLGLCRRRLPALLAG